LENRQLTVSDLWLCRSGPPSARFASPGPRQLALAPMRCAPVSLGERHLSASPPRFLWLPLRASGALGRGLAPMVGRPPVLFAVIAQPVRPSGGSRNEKRGGENSRNNLVGAPSRFQAVLLPVFWVCPWSFGVHAQVSDSFRFLLGRLQSLDKTWKDWIWKRSMICYHDVTKVRKGVSRGGTLPPSRPSAPE
jgi:hypothetical protein